MSPRLSRKGQRRVGVPRVRALDFLVIVVETSQITPPVGFNLFVLQGLTQKNILLIVVAALPFFFLRLLAVVLVTVFPEIATWLPRKMSG